MLGPDWQFLFVRAIDLELMLRVVLAFVLGGLIGYEREMIERPAGLRTHMLVAAGSAAFTVASVYGFVGEGTVLGRNPRGWKADVRYVPSSENRSHGASLGAKLADFCNGTRFRYVFR